MWFSGCKIMWSVSYRNCLFQTEVCLFSEHFRKIWNVWKQQSVRRPRYCRTEKVSFAFLLSSVGTKGVSLVLCVWTKTYKNQVCHWRWGCWTRLCLCRGRLREDEGLTILNSNKLVGIGFSSSLHCQNIIKFLVFLSFQHLSDDCHHHIIIFVIIYPGFEQRLLVPAHSRHLLQALGQLQPAGGHERGADADA